MHGFRIGRLRGIEVRLHWSVLVIFWLVMASLADTVLPDASPGRPESRYWVAGAVAAVVFLVTLVAHEFGHSIVAQRNRVQVESVTLWFLGGVASLKTMPDNAGASLRIAAAGPAVSAVLAAAFLTGAAVADEAVPGGLLASSLLWIGTINVVLAVFNLLPAFPLDGGRIYHAWVWSRERDVEVANRRAASLGRTIGTGLIVLGVLEALTISLISGLWLAMIGWFLREAAHAEINGARLEHLLERYRVSDVMSSDPATVPADWSVEEFVQHQVSAGRHAAYPVVDAHGGPVGLVGIADVRRLPAERWAAATVGSVARPLAAVPTVHRADDLTQLSSVLRTSDATRALVIDDGRLVGIVAPSDLARLMVSLRTLAEIDPPTADPGAQPPDPAAPPPAGTFALTGSDTP